MLDYTDWLGVCVGVCVCMCILWVVCPECNSAVSRRGEEGQVLRVPSTLDHLVPVLSHHGQRQLLCQVTLEVGDHDFGVIGASEQIVGTRRKPDGAHVTAVWPVHLNDPTSSDVIQHAGTVFLS